MSATVETAWQCITSILSAQQFNYKHSDQVFKPPYYKVGSACGQDGAALVVWLAILSR